jgi:hypothetical protein
MSSFAALRMTWPGVFVTFHSLRRQKFMQDNDIQQSKQEAWYYTLWDRLIHSRLPVAASIAAVIAFFTSAGQPDVLHWFLLALATVTPALLLLAWLLGEVVIAAITFVEEWRDVLSSYF